MPAKTPFSEDEKNLVQDLVLKYKAVIENKRTDAISINAKAKAWEKLCTDFNSRPFVRPRDVKQLKKLRVNMKQRWKREKARPIRDDLTTDRTEELSQTDRAAMQSMLQSSHTPSVVGEDSLCLDDPKVDADMSQEEAAKPGAQSEAPTAGSSVRNVRGGRLSLLQHTLDVELKARLDAIKADKNIKKLSTIKEWSV
ncbi:hypothetical protein MRX96_050076 [Rhipicephalus microplus]